MSKTILVTGPTGNIASLVIPQLLKNGTKVRAFVRSAAKAEALKKQGVEIFMGDFSDLSALEKATSGVDAILFITSAGPNAIAEASNVIQAAKKSGTPYLVRISAIKAAPDAPTENGRSHYATDVEIQNSGLPYTILRPHFFMQNLMMSIPTILSQGAMYWSMGDGKMGIIDVRDIADCCVSLLMNGGHDGKIYNPTGPSSLNYTEIASAFSKGLGKTVNYIPVPLEAVGTSIREMGMGEWFATLMTDYSRAYTANWGNYINDDVKTLTGHEARSIDQFVNEVVVPIIKHTAVTA